MWCITDNSHFICYVVISPKGEILCRPSLDVVYLRKFRSSAKIHRKIVGAVWVYF